MQFLRSRIAIESYYKVECPKECWTRSPGDGPTCRQPMPVHRRTSVVQAHQGHPMTIYPSRGELILYRTQDGRTAIRLRVVDRTVWLAQAEMAALFDTSVQNVSLHLKNTFEDNELDQTSVI